MGNSIKDIRQYKKDIECCLIPDENNQKWIIENFNEALILKSTPSIKRFYLMGYWFCSFMNTIILPYLKLKKLIYINHLYEIFNKCKADCENDSKLFQPASYNEIYDFLVSLGDDNNTFFLKTLTDDYLEYNDLQNALIHNDRDEFYQLLKKINPQVEVLQSANIVIQSYKLLSSFELNVGDLTLGDFDVLTESILNSVSRIYQIQSSAIDSYRNAEMDFSDAPEVLNDLRTIYQDGCFESRNYVTIENRYGFIRWDKIAINLLYFIEFVFDSLDISENLIEKSAKERLFCENIDDLIIPTENPNLKDISQTEHILRIVNRLREDYQSWNYKSNHKSKNKREKGLKKLNKQFNRFEKTLPRIKDKVRQLAECLTKPVNGKTYLLEEDKITFYYRICGELVGDDTMDMVKEDVIKWGDNWPSLKYIIQKIYTQYHVGYPEDSATFPKGFDIFIAENYVFWSVGNRKYKKKSVSTIKENPENSSKISQKNFPEEERRCLDKLLKNCQLMSDRVK